MAHTIRGREAVSKGTVGHIFATRADEAGKIPGRIVDTVKVNQIPPSFYRIVFSEPRIPV